MNDKIPSTPIRGAAQLERDRLKKLSLCAAGILAGVLVLRMLYKPLLGAAAALFLITRPPVKHTLSRFTGWLLDVRE